jgi:hypothetical protein
MENAFVPVMLEEYKTLRDESLQAINNQLSVLKMGTGAIGLLLAAGFSLPENEGKLAALIFITFLPLVSYLSLIIWIGEFERMIRVSRFIASIEKKISDALGGENILSWESRLWIKNVNSKTPQMTVNYLSIIGLFYLISGISIYIGFDKIPKLGRKEDYSNLFIICVSFSVLASILVLIRQY